MKKRTCCMPYSKLMVAASKQIGFPKNLMQNNRLVSSYLHKSEDDSAILNAKFPNYEADSAVNTRQLVMLMNKMIEDAERDRQTAETRFIESQKFEKKSFRVNVANMIFALIAAICTLGPIIVMLIKLLSAQH